MDDLEKAAQFFGEVAGLTAERDRYKAALNTIAQHRRAPMRLSTHEMQQVASRALAEPEPTATDPSSAVDAASDQARDDALLRMGDHD